jgi:hypothetical protein
MKSPFAIFRKNQKVAMVVLGVLVMFAFVIGPALQDLSSSGIPASLQAMMIAVLGAVILGGIGYTSGRAKEYAMTGFVLGAVIGVVLPRYFGAAPAVESTAGNLTEQQLRRLIDRKRIANQFLIAAYDTTLSDMERQYFNNPQLAQFFVQQRMQRQQWFNRYYFDDANEANVLQTFLMNHEAEQMGITVSNDTINDYIRLLTLTQRTGEDGATKTNSLTPTQYHAIVKRMGLSEKDLFDALREEIKAKMAMELIAPPMLSTPLQYWQSYQKLNVRQELDAVALDVEAFTAIIEDPSEGELTAFFDENRELFPNQNGPGTPGFRQPQRITLESLEVDYVSAEEEVLKAIDTDLLTPEERETELKSERLRIDEAVADVDKKIQDKTIKKEDEIEEKDLAGESEILKLLEDGQEINRLEFKIAKYYEDNKNVRYRNRILPDDFLDRNNALDDSPFFSEPETSSEKNQPQETQNDSESDNSQPVSAKKPEDDQQKQDSPEEKQPESDDSESGSSESKNPSEPEKDNSDNGSALLETEAGLFQVASILDDADQSDAKPDAKPNANQDDSSKSGDEKKKSGDEKIESADEKKTPSTTEDTNEIPATRRGPEPPPLPEDPPLPRYRPLDAELKDEIRDELIDQETTKTVNQRIADAMGFMRELEEKYEDNFDRLRRISRENDEDKLDKKTANEMRKNIAGDLNDYAKRNNLVYGKTESLSYPEFLEQNNQEQYPIASADVPSADPFSQKTTILDRVFSRNSEEYSRSQAEAGSGNGNKFAYWKTEDIESFIPESLAESGIRKQVLHAWKIGKAREEVLKRAEELKEIVRNSEADMSESLEEETLTGKKGDIKLTVQPTESFSWLETGLQNPSNPLGQQQTAQIWDISTIEKAGNDFMKKVFEELQDGDVGVAYNFDKSIYYVVKVKNRSTSVPGSMRALQQGFHDEWSSVNNNITYSRLIQQNHQSTAFNWRDRFYEEKYNLQRNPAEANR